MTMEAATANTHPDPQSQLDELEAAYLDGRYGELWALVQAWEAAWPQAALAQRQRARILGLHTLSKQGQWARLVSACAETWQEFLPAADAPLVKLLVIWSFGELQQGALLRALELAQVGLFLATNQNEAELCAQMHERLAMAELNLGNAVMAESHMLESIGYALQQNDQDVCLLRFSNGLFLFNTLRQALKTQGRAAQAHALRLRMQRYVTQGRKVESLARKPYERCMWRANVAVWQLRCGHSREAERELRRIQSEAQQAAWLQIRRAAELELAGIAAAERRWEQALVLLQDTLLPGEPPLRQRQALHLERSLAQVWAGLGMQEQAAQATERAEALVREQRALQHESLPPELSQSLSSTLPPDQRQWLSLHLEQARRYLRDPTRLRVRGVA